MKAKIASTLIFLFAAACTAWLFVGFPRFYWPPTVFVAAGVLVLVLASAGVFLWPCLSYWLGMLSGLVTLAGFLEGDFGGFVNSWIAFNLPESTVNLLEAKARIIFVAAVVVSTACSVTRLLPSAWMLRRSPVRERTWPAFAVCLLVIALWFGGSASPYRIPLIVDAVGAELTLLHVEKRGIQFHETSIRVYRDGKFYLSRNDRRLFQYRFAERIDSGVLPEAVTTTAITMARSTQLKDLRTPPAMALRSHNAEGWYIRTSQTVLAFNTEYGTKPPKDVVDLFHLSPSIQQSII